MPEVEEQIGNGGVEVNAGAGVNAVAVRPPVFSETAAAVWFRVLETQFRIARITTTGTKFIQATSALPMSVLENVPENVLENENYDELKQAVISFHESTKPELFEQLISSKAMTGRPSVYLREIQKVASQVGAGDDLVRHKFISALPSTIAPIIATQKTLSLVQLGSMADELMPLHNQINIVNHRERKQSFSSSDRKARDFSVGESNENIPIGLRPFHKKQRPNICRAHIYYADQAKTCKPWCRYPNKSNCRMQRSHSRSSSPRRMENSEN